MSEKKINLLRRVAPGLDTIIHYRRENFRFDVVAGLSVAAVALPVGIAYAEIAGVPSVCLLYTSPSPRDGLLSRMPSSA